MAVTLQEQRSAFDDPTLRIKAGSALNFWAQAVLVEVGTTPNHTNRVIFAKQALFAGPGNSTYVDAVLRAAIAANAGAASLAALLAATDVAVQSAVSAAADAMANGG